MFCKRVSLKFEMTLLDVRMIQDPVLLVAVLVIIAIDMLIVIIGTFVPIDLIQLHQSGE